MEQQFKLKIVTAMEKVLASKEPSGDGMEQKITLLKGENVSFQIAYYWEGNRKERGTLQIESPLKDRIHVRTVQLVPCEYPCHMLRDEDYLSTEPGLYPDLLKEVPEWGFPLVSGQWRSLWVDVEASEETEAGIYPVKIDLLKDGEVVGTVNVQAEILNAVLPDLDVPHTEWFHSDCLADYYHTDVFSDEYWRVVENFMRTAVKRGCNMILTPVFTPPLDTAVGGERRTVQLVHVEKDVDSYSFDFGRFKHWIALAQKCGMKYFEMSHLFSQWGAVAAPKIMGTVNGEECRIFGWETDAAGKEYATFLHQFLPKLRLVLRELGIEEFSYFHISDEPEMSQLKSYQAARKAAQRDLEGCNLFDALSDYSFYEEGLVDQPVCALNHIEPFLAKRPEKLWGYYCTAQCVDVSNRFIVQEGYRTRILGAQMYKYQLAGFLHWGYNFYNSEYSLYPINPYLCTDAGGAFPSGDPFLVYPGEDGMPEESIRLMLMDEAMADLRAMKYLESISDRETVLNCIEANPEEEVTFDKYPRNFTYMVRCRERVNSKIKQLIQS